MSTRSLPADSVLAERAGGRPVGLCRLSVVVEVVGEPVGEGLNASPSPWTRTQRATYQRNDREAASPGLGRTA